MQIRNLYNENDYALWPDVTEKADCYLLNECLAKLRTYTWRYNPFPIGDKLKWRYEVYRKVEDLTPIISSYWTVVNLFNGMIKKIKYTEKKR